MMLVSYLASLGTTSGLPDADVAICVPPGARKASVDPSDDRANYGVGSRTETYCEHVTWLVEKGIVPSWASVTALKERMRPEAFATAIRFALPTTLNAWP